jgi:hypothetical protein
MPTFALVSRKTQAKEPADWETGLSRMRGCQLFHILIRYLQLNKQLISSLVIYSTPLSVLTLSRFNSVHIPKTHFPKTRIVQGFSHQNSVQREVGKLCLERGQSSLQATSSSPRGERQSDLNASFKVLPKEKMRGAWNPLRASYLDSCLHSCRSVCPAASRSREKAFYWLLKKHPYSIPLLLMISISLPAVNYFVFLACVGVCRYWLVTARNTTSK